MDLASKHGDAVRWRVVVANHRPSQVKRILANQFTMPGFNDSGAHIRNMAFHDGALHMLRMAARDPAWMSPVRWPWLRRSGGSLVVLDRTRVP